MYSIERIDSNTFKLIGDTNKIKETFSYMLPQRMYNYKSKRMEFVNKEHHLYDRRSSSGAIFHSGLAPMIYYHFYDELDDTKSILLEYTKAERIDYQFTELRGSQEVDLAELLKFRRGIFSVYTGYGKTQVISKLVDYIVNIRNEKVLVITPSSPALEEIKLRVRNISGLTSKYFDYNSKYNAMNINGFLRSGSYDKENPYWKEVKWIIADEVEYCLTDNAKKMLNLCTNVDRCYGFSGTADKGGANRLVMRDGLTDIVKHNRSLIAYFGFSIVYRKPEQFNIDLISIKTSIFNDLQDVRLSESTIYSEVVNEIFTNKRFCDGFKKIVHKERGGIYIPMVRLTVIKHWLKEVFTWENGSIVNICGSGISLWSEGKRVKSLTLEELKRMVELNEVEVIVGTRSSFRALDLPNLNKIILLTSQIASNVIQQVGRVARKGKFQIISLVPMIYVSCYSNDMKKRNQLIKNYYSDSNVREFKRTDIEYGIY